MFLIGPCYEPGTENPVCQNGGICRIINNAHVCECTAAYGGQNCTKPHKSKLILMIFMIKLRIHFFQHHFVKMHRVLVVLEDVNNH